MDFESKSGAAIATTVPNAPFVGAEPNEGLMQQRRCHEWLRMTEPFVQRLFFASARFAEAAERG
jgi:hypothetical protein